MTKQYNVQICAAINGINLVNGEHHFVSLEKDNLVLPFVALDDLSIEYILCELCKQYIDLDSSWLCFDIIGIYQEEDTLLIIYRCTIPLDTKLINSYWMPLWKCLQNPITKLITYKL
jgi:hypothetical protein